MKVGFAREDITLFEYGMTMFGWGRPDHQVRGVAEPLFARAMAVEGDDRFVYVVVDLLLVSQGLWLEVVSTLERDHPELGLSARNVVLVATHTHSGPSGYSHHFWLNLNAPGFSPVVYDGLLQRLVRVIVAAFAAATPGIFSVSGGQQPLSDGIAFNRSWWAYSANDDTEPVPFERRDEATDRQHTVLCFEGEDGSRAVVDWFGLHGTTVHADHDVLHPDHKGLAARTFEERGMHALFAQECCGDVSPNYRESARGHTVGRFEDDFVNADYVAAAQVRRVEELLTLVEPAGEKVAVAARFVDFSRARAEAAFTHPRQARQTTPARLGISMARGTAEGRGPLYNAAWLTDWLNRSAGEDNKFALLELARGDASRVAQFLPMRWVPPLDPVVGWIGAQVRRGTAGSAPWIPHVLPVQVLRIGRVLVLAVPFETTTVAGRRLRATAAANAPEGVDTVVLSPYANAYCGYLTTFEEYRCQHYEAGYTLFGPHTLAALRTTVAELVRELGSPEMAGPRPQPASRASLEALAFDQPW